METQDLKELIKESVREVLHEERLALSQMLIPYVNDEEQLEIESELGSHPQEEELTDMTAYIRYGS